MRMVAEGVEIGEQMAFLRDRGCDLAQGYYLSRPLPAEELTGFLKKETEDGRLIADS